MKGWHLLDEIIFVAATWKSSMSDSIVGLDCDKSAFFSLSFEIGMKLFFAKLRIAFSAFLDRAWMVGAKIIVMTQFGQ